jgi:Tfp pilus assembly protein PilX
MFLNSPHFRKIKLPFSLQQVEGLLRRRKDSEASGLSESRRFLNSHLDQATGFQNRGRGGFALVFALAMLVLLMTIVLAYFSNAMLHRQISVASAANLKVQLITKTAADLILDDFQHEIEAGSLADANPKLTMPIRRPITLTANGTGVTNMLAPSVVPQRIGNGGVTNIVKVSRSGLSFFTNGSGYRTLSDRAANGLARASSISTTNTSANGRFLTKERWLAPKLMGDSETNAFTVPDWIYLNRKGETPTDFTASALTTAANSNSTNTGFVIGRYAYTVYDVGGLLDINVIGNALPSTNNAIRGLAHQVSLSNGIGGVSVPNFTNFVAWRSAVSSTNTNAASGSGGLFDPKRNFIDVPASEQAFVNRQDLLNYVAQSGSPIPSAALPFLTTFSRDLNAPSYEPNSARSKLPATPSADVMNPAILTARFTTNVTLSRPDTGSITVNSGTPVMVRRFPLSKLNIFAQTNPDPTAMSYYFGLTNVDPQTWKYSATNSSKGIYTLSEVAALKREPNFFEVLQAGILTGSIGKNGTDTYTTESLKDSDPTLQIIQIGANIIDQWDANDVPTGIQYPKTAVDNWSLYGIENLPYINQIGLVGWRPTDDRDLFQVWALFDVWNPHQNAKTLPNGVDGFRIVPTAGAGRNSLKYYTSVNYTSTPEYQDYQTSTNNLVAINSGRVFSFSSTQDYSEPTTIGSTPTSKNDTPGILMHECRPGVAIPAAALRSSALNVIVAKLEADTGKTVGVKAFNTCRLRSWPIGPDYKGWEFALQVHRTGDPATKWYSYQKYESFGLNQFDTMSSPVANSLSIDELPLNTQYGSPNATLVNEFYTWRSKGATAGMIKVDPRTSRFGLSGWSASSSSSSVNDFLGYSTRNSTNTFPANFLTDAGNIINTSVLWCFPVGLSVGKDKNNILVSGFEVIPAFTKPPQANRAQIGLYSLVANNPDVLSTNYPVRYSDPDSIIRPGDGYLGGFPTVRGQTNERPLMLNRAFRSVGELGYVFRDMPWKTLDFFSRRSADLGLLDMFSISDTDSSLPVVAGRVNLNSRQTAVLKTILLNANKFSSTVLSDAEAQAIAQAIVTESASNPFLDKGDLVTRVFNKGTGTDPLSADTFKTRREAALRALVEMGTTRTWNFLIDLVAQTGRFTAASKTGSDFMVQSEERVWIHVSIDRVTGEILEIRKENVNE